MSLECQNAHFSVMANLFLTSSQTSEVTNVIDLLEEFLIRLNYIETIILTNKKKLKRAADKDETFSVVTGAHQPGPGHRRSR